MQKIQKINLQKKLKIIAAILSVIYLSSIVLFEYRILVKQKQKCHNDFIVNECDNPVP